MTTKPFQTAMLSRFSHLMGVGVILSSLCLGMETAAAEETGLVAKVNLQAPTTSFLNTTPKVQTPITPNPVNVTKPLENALQQLSEIKQTMQQIKPQPLESMAAESVPSAVAAPTLSSDELKKLSKKERAKYDALMKAFNEVHSKEAKLNEQQAALQKRLAELEAANEEASKQIDMLQKQTSTTNPSPTLARK